MTGFGPGINEADNDRSHGDSIHANHRTDPAESLAGPVVRSGLGTVSEDTSPSWPIVLPIIFGVILSVVIRAFNLDVRISSLSYDFEQEYWPFERAQPWLGFYRYGIYLPMLLGLMGLIAAAFGHWIVPVVQRSNRVRREGLFLVLMLLIGPGLLVNSGLKSLWGRPRPVQCQEFGGELAFKQVGEMATERFPNSSFPSGHAAIAFFLMAPAFMAGADQRRLRRRWLFTGLGFGLAMGFTRVLQGGHFTSDVLWAGIIVYVVGVVLAKVMLFPTRRHAQPERSFVHETISISPTS